MQNAARRGDKDTGHDDAGGRPANKGSPDVHLNDKPALRQGDELVAHGPDQHKGKVKKGSSTVTFNDMPAARVGDPVDCGGEMKTGSADVFIGD